MPRAFVRLDDRLIHGQVVLGWVPFLRPRRIVVLSAEVHRDPMAAAVMAMAVPEEIDFTTADPAAPPREYFEDPATLVLAATPEDLLPAAAAGSLEEINVGGIRTEGGREYRRDLRLRAEQVEAFRALLARGLRIEHRLIPSGPAESLAEILDGGPPAAGAP